jgi:anti-sigma regulatory factor (Ser/Thr protein kinase)
MMVEAELPQDARAAFQARGHVARFRCGLTPAQLIDALQVVSELATNAYLHGQGRITLRLEDSPPGLRARVEDEGNGFDPKDASGLGLTVVREMSDAWGLDDGRPAVWFEIGTGRAGS